MHRFNVRTPEDALAYITDCALATVETMAMKTRRQKREFERQIAIAQTAVTWMQQMGVDASSTRVEEVIKAGSVKKWAEQYLPENQRGYSAENG